MNKKNYFLTDAQLKEEINKCEFCEEKPCKEACPANCSPADFIMAVKCGKPSDYQRAAHEILKNNPFGEVCGLVCPDSFCVKACVHKNFSSSIKIQPVQATVVRRAREMGLVELPEEASKTEKKVAIVGAGPAGLGAAVFLAQKGHDITVFESSKKIGGTIHLIPELRLPGDALDEELDYIKSFKNITFQLGKRTEHVDDIRQITDDSFDAILITTGLSKALGLPVKGAEKGILFTEFLKDKRKFSCRGEVVAIVGGGPAAADCAWVAKERGAKRVEMFVLEKLAEMPLTKLEMDELIKEGIEVSSRVRITEIKKGKKGLFSLGAVKVYLSGKEGFRLKDIEDEPDTKHVRTGYSKVIFAIGSKREEFNQSAKKDASIFYAGDYGNGPTTIVEAVASGKNAAGKIDAFLSKSRMQGVKKDRKSYMSIDGYNPRPIDLSVDFFGRKIKSPFLLSAAPPTDGYAQVKTAYEAGWAGAVMKTAFDDVSIHIPSEYMFTFAEGTYGNCDNVSGHGLKRVCEEVKKLVKEFPDCLTIASTGGPVSGKDEEDKKKWQKNTKMIEEAGAHGIEYSLSCPQGGDGTEGDIVSQNAALTAKIIGWILDGGNPDVPKLFKLTGAVTSIKPIIMAVKEVLLKYPRVKAGVTLANTFPVLGFRDNSSESKKWDEGVVFGMSGEGVIPISNLTLANAGPMGVVISGNGGPMDYLTAANFLALGASTVQFCTIALKYGYKIINDLESGLSHLLKHRDISSVGELIGISLPHPITDFMKLTSTKKISDCNAELCMSCGNCTRCPYLAMTLDEDKHPETDSSKCIGCSLCVKKCFAGALFMRERTKLEMKVLKED